MKLAEGYVIKEVDDECILFPIGQNVADNKKIVSLNKNGRYVLNRLLEGATRDQLIQEFIEMYEPEGEKDFIRIEEDVDGYIERLLYYGFVVED